MLVRAGRNGTVTYVDADRIEIGDEVYTLRKFVGLNERTCLNQKPIVKIGPEGRRRARSSPTAPPRIKGELALGRNVLVAFMSWDGLQLRGRDHHQRTSW